MNSSLLENKENDYLGFVYNFYNLIKENKIVLVYEGIVNQEVTKVFTSMTEQKAEKEQESSKTTKKLYHVMVECLQNVCKHSDQEETGMPESPGSGVFIVSKNEEKYWVTTGNVVSNEKVDFISSMINKFNSLNEDEIKELYKKMIKEGTLSEKAGAGLGFIDIVKKTGNKIDFRFTPLNDKTSFFIQNISINKE